MMARMGEEGLLLLRTAKREGGTCPLTSEPGRRSPSVCTRNPSALTKAAGGHTRPWCQIPNLKITSAPRVGRHLRQGRQTPAGR